MQSWIRLADLGTPELDIYTKYNENQLAHIFEPQKEGLFIAESPMVIERALQAGYEPVSALVAEEQREAGSVAAFWKNEQLARAFENSPVYCVEEAKMRDMTGYPLTRGFLCAMRRRPLAAAEEILRRARRVAILENVMNPTNVGAIFRSAAALGMDAVLLTEGASDPLYRRAARVSVGTVFQIPWTFFSKADSEGTGYLEILKQSGFVTVAMALREDAVSIADPRLEQAEKLAVLLGTESTGLRADTIASCDVVARIPMAHGVDSLNVAAASAVMFWQLGTKRAEG